MELVGDLETYLVLPALGASLHSATDCRCCTGIHHGVGRSEYGHESPKKVGDDAWKSSGLRGERM